MVIDKSGSMEGERMDLVRETSHFLVDQLKATDLLGVVAYNSTVSGWRLSRSVKLSNVEQGENVVWAV